MTITNGYCTLAELNARFDFTVGADSARDTVMEKHIEAASRWIDGYTGRQFYATSATRYFTATSGVRLNVSELLTVTTLKTDADGDRTYETTWSATDYDLMPFNHAPYQWIEVTPNGLNTFPLYNKGVEIAGTWGYVATTPSDIKEACLLHAARLYAREAAVLGVGSASALGTLTVKAPKDEDIEALLEPFVKRGMR